MRDGVRFQDSIQFRLGMISVLLAFFFAVGVYIYQYNEINQIIKGFYLEEANRHCQSVVKEMYDNPDDIRGEGLNRYLLSPSSPETFSHLYSWQLFSENLVVLSASNRNNIGNKYFISPPNLKTINSNEPVFNKTGNFYQIISPLYDQNKQRIGGLEIVYPAAPLYNLLSQMQIRFYEPLIIAVLALIMGYFTWQRLVQQPLTKFKTDIDKIRADQSTRLIPIVHHDEIGLIMVSFNNLLNDLRINIDELESTKQQTQAFSDELKSAYERLETQIAEMKEAKDQITELYMVIEKVNIDLDKKVIELSILNEVGRAISSILDLDHLLNMIIKWATEEMGAKQGAILLNDADHEMTVQAIYNLDESLLGNKLLPSVSDDHAEEFIPAIAIPLKGKGITIGVINIGAKTSGRSFTSDDLNLLSTLANQAAIAIENAKLYETVQKGYFDTIQALTLAIEAKDVYTRGHSARVTEYAVTIASLIGLPPERLENLRYAAVLHDVGKIGIREEILRKEGELSEIEYNIMKKHPTIGESIIEPINFLEPVRSIIRSHHEWYDGNGYPDGLKAEEISLEARILSLADAFDSMTSNRPYRKGMTLKGAINQLEKSLGNQFEPRLVKVFSEWLMKNPPDFTQKEEQVNAGTTQGSDNRAVGDHRHRTQQTAI